MPAAMVIPAPCADIYIVAVKKLIGLFAIAFSFQKTMFSFDEYIQFAIYCL